MPRKVFPNGLERGPVIRLEKLAGKAEFLSPLRAFGREVQEFEYRLDPLTGHVSVICRGRSSYIMKHFSQDEELLEQLIRSSRPNCPFCPGAVEQKTPKFPPEVAPEGRLRLGDCWAVPALYAHADFNAIIILGPEHFRPLDQMEKALLRDGLSLALEVLRRAFRAYPRLKHAAVIMGHLPTAGSSLLHPHMQVLAMPVPFNRARDLLEKSLEYHRATSRNFWADLVELEAREGSRLIGHIGRTWWLAPFAPSGRYEVWGLVENVPDLLSLSGRDVECLADGISRVLRAYADMGIMAFNMALFSGLLGEDSRAYFWPQIRLCARFGLRTSRLSDFWALPVLLGTDEVFEAPEDYAARFRNYFA